MDKNCDDKIRNRCHSVRSAATSKANEKCVPIQEILQTAEWSNTGTFAKLYKKPIQTKDGFAITVLWS
ncbi:hypothetical protein DPMN_114953 [Dreissena polymorpha]|uniref:Uncharacterized protein n=1 Tax=Dreissena polymorpha TaxID=45954 RepID=A0A9D4KL16_DREPO|nr:hypothetical protein DPMN_114953 [Dreissena polymorpha]